MNTCGQDVLKIFSSAPVHLNTICHCASKQYGTCFKTILKSITSPGNWLCLDFLWTNEKSCGSHLSPKGELNVNITKHLKSIKRATSEVRFTHTFTEMQYFNPNALLGSISAIPYRSKTQSYPVDDHVHPLGGCSILTPRKELSVSDREANIVIATQTLNQVSPPSIIGGSRAAWWW